ncbi:MAG TPA: HD domain-containing protein [Thermotogota bacterium]|nr:HD domain-containing protein [Thermotogota bacterium]HPJ88900.1 HD domain-containing protein [Thermotogota bacterium]HPR95280.1 HD domain-containing protein [Thermotogota bacterium]
MKEFPLKGDSALIQELFMKFYMMAELIDIQSDHHIQKIGWLSGRISEILNKSADFCTNMEFAAPLHDIGNIAISDTILKKPYRITIEEKKQIESHTRVGYEILRDSSSEILRMASLIAKYHHERFNGSGYPEGIRGYDIPLEARIVAVADSLDAIIDKRPYKSAKPVEEGIEEILRLSGSLYDPAVSETLIVLKAEIGDQYRLIS